MLDFVSDSWGLFFPFIKTFFAYPLLISVPLLVIRVAREFFIRGLRPDD